MLRHQKALAGLLGFLALSMLLVDIVVVAPSVVPYVEWSKTYKGVPYTEARSAEQTSDGGYIIVGETGENLSGSLAWLVKTDPGGVVQWNRTYSQYAIIGAESVDQTSDGGYVFAGGCTNSINGSLICLIVKTDPNGGVLWNKTYGAGEAIYVRQTLDSGLILLCYGDTGETNLLLKTDSIGKMQWNKTLRGGFGSVQQTDDGGYILGGYTWTVVSYPLLLKVDSIGNVLWNRTYGGSYSSMISVQQTRDGGYIFATVTGWYTESQRVLLVKVAPNGTTQWSKGCGIGNQPQPYLVQQTEDGGYIVLGAGVFSDFFTTYGRYWLAKTDSGGNPLWIRIFEKQYNGCEVYPIFCQQTSDGGYAVVGSAYIRDTQFHELFKQTYFWLAKLTDYPSSISVATYLALALGTSFCILAAVAIMAKRRNQ
jgi:hypothetical protein